MKILSLSWNHAQVGTEDVISSDNEVSTEVALVLIEKLAGRDNEWADSGLAAGVESLELQVWRLEEVHELGIGSCSRTAAVNVGGDVVNFLTVLLYDNWSASGSCVSCEYDTSIVLDTANGCTGLLVWHGLDDVFLLKELVSGFK